MDIKEIPPVATVATFARITGQSEYTVRKQCREGVLPGAVKHPGQREWRIRTAEALGVSR